MLYLFHIYFWLQQC